LIAAVSQSITWVKVERPVFDLGGVILSSLGIAGLCAALALVFGSALGALLIGRTLRRRALGLDDAPLALHLAGPVNS
jgi:hypothetical protein